MQLKKHTSSLILCNYCGLAFENTKQGRWDARQHILKLHKNELEAK